MLLCMLVSIIDGGTERDIQTVKERKKEKQKENTQSKEERKIFWLSYSSLVDSNPALQCVDIFITNFVQQPPPPPPPDVPH